MNKQCLIKKYQTKIIDIQTKLPYCFFQEINVLSNKILLNIKTVMPKEETMSTTSSKSKISKPTGKGQLATIHKCADIKAAISKELKIHIKETSLRNRLFDALSGEVAYNTGGGGGVGVA
jgi:hypothetical protein